MLTSSQVVRPGYRGRGRPPLMTKHRGLTHFESYSRASAESEDLSAESFMEQKLEDGDSEIEEEKNLDAIRETSRALEMVRAAELQKDSTETNAVEEMEDIKPDISSEDFTSQNTAGSITTPVVSSDSRQSFHQTPELNNSFQPNQPFGALSGANSLQQLQQQLHSPQEQQQLQNTSQHFYSNESQSSNHNNISSPESSEREYQVR